MARLMTIVTVLQQAMTVRAHYAKEKNSVLDKGLQMVREQCSAGRATTYVRTYVQLGVAVEYVRTYVTSGNKTYVRP